MRWLGHLFVGSVLPLRSVASALCFRAEAGIAARRPPHFLCLAKESKQRKATRSQGHFVVPCAARARWGLAKLASLKQTRALFPPKSALLAVPDGRWGAGTDGCCCAATPCCFNRRARLLRSAGAHGRFAQHIKQRHTSAAGCTDVNDFISAFASSPAPAFPVGRAEQRSARGIRARVCLSVSEFSETPPGASSAGNHEVALTPGRLFFGYFLLAKQKKVARPPGRTPGLHPETKNRRHRAQRQSRAQASPPDPAPACQGQVSPPPPPPSDQSPQTDSAHCAPSSRCGSCPHTS